MEKLTMQEEEAMRWIWRIGPCERCAGQIRGPETSLYDTRFRDQESGAKEVREGETLWKYV